MMIINVLIELIQFIHSSVCKNYDLEREYAWKIYIYKRI